MAAVSSLFEDQLLCPICLEVFIDPVSTSCGHNFCKRCITKHWDNNDCSCPICKKVFDSRPLLHVNTFISEIVSQFKSETLEKEDGVNSEKPAPETGVLCDICTEPRLKAVKSCTVCLFSYCHSHLEPHLTVPRLQKHQLTEPVDNLEDRLCSKHDKPLELFCCTDRACICMVCSVLDHKGHDIVPLKEEYEKHQAAMKQTSSQTRLMVKERQEKLQGVRHALELSQNRAQRELIKGMQVYNTLLETVTRSRDQFQDEVQAKQTRAEKQAVGLITALELELSELQRRSTQIDQLSCSEDYLNFIQNFKTLTPLPDMNDWSQVSFKPRSYGGAVEQHVSQLNLALTEQLSPKAALKRLQKWAVDVNLDPDTASPWLYLSDDLKLVSDRGVIKAVPKNPKRFSDFLCVLGKQGFSSGKFYYEVQVSGNPNWDLGVVKESINKKDKNFLSSENGAWTIIYRGGNKYTACDIPSVDLCLKPAPQRIGVFVDYEEGLVSFYDAVFASHIYSFIGCTFTEKLYPFFSPGNYVKDNINTPAVLVITPVGK